MDFPHIGISWIEGQSTTAVDAFAERIHHPQLDLVRRPRPPEQVRPGLELSSPTAIFVFVGKGYFDAFVKGNGADHYPLLQEELARLTEEEIAAGASTQQYLLNYSVLAELGGGYWVKLLLQPDLTTAECSQAIAGFLAFAESLHNGTVDVTSVRGLQTARDDGRMLLLALDRSSGKLETVNPVEADQS